METCGPAFEWMHLLLEVGDGDGSISFPLKGLGQDPILQRAKGWISPQNILFFLLLLLGGALACWPVPTELSEGERVLGLKPEEKLS